MNIIKTNAVLNAETIEIFNKNPHDKYLCSHGTIFLFSNDQFSVMFLAVGWYCPDAGRGFINTDYLVSDGKTDPKEAIRIITEGKWDNPTHTTPRRAQFTPKAPKAGYHASAAKTMRVTIPISFFGRECVLDVAGDYTQVEKFISHVRSICDAETMECKSEALFYKIVRDWEYVVSINLNGDNFRDVTAERVFDLKRLIGREMPEGTHVQLYTGMVLGVDKFKETVKDVLGESGVEKHPYAVYVTGNDYLLVVGSNSANDRDAVSELLNSYDIPRTYNDLAKRVYDNAINEKKA